MSSQGVSAVWVYSTGLVVGILSLSAACCHGGTGGDGWLSLRGKSVSRK